MGLGFLRTETQPTTLMARGFNSYDICPISKGLENFKRLPVLLILLLYITDPHEAFYLHNKHGELTVKYAPQAVWLLANKRLG